MSTCCNLSNTTYGGYSATNKNAEKIDSLYENLKSHQDTCNALNHKLSEIVNDQSTFNETVTHNMEIQWSAIRIIVNQIKEKE